MATATTTMRHTVSTYRQCGLEARWTKTHTGAPVIVVRNPSATMRHQREQWWMVDRAMVEMMTRKGVLDGFDCATALGNYFSI